MGSFLSVLFGTEERPGREEGVDTVDTFSNNSLSTPESGNRGGIVEALVDLIAPLPASPQVFSRLRTFASYSEQQPGEAGVVSSSLRLLFVRPNGGFAIKFWASTKRHSANHGGSDPISTTIADHQVVAYGSWQEDQGHGQVLDLRIDSLLYRRYVDPGLEIDQYPGAETPDLLEERVLGALPSVVWEEREDGGVAANVRTAGMVVRARYVLTPDPVPNVESLLIATSSPPDWLAALEMAEFPSEHPLAGEWPSLSPIDNPSTVVEDGLLAPTASSTSSGLDDDDDDHDDHDHDHDHDLVVCGEDSLQEGEGGD